MTETWTEEGIEWTAVVFIWKAELIGLSDGLCDDGWGDMENIMKERKELGVTLRFLAWKNEWMMVPFIKIGKTGQKGTHWENWDIYIEEEVVR